MAAYFAVALLLPQAWAQTFEVGLGARLATAQQPVDAWLGVDGARVAGATLSLQLRAPSAQITFGLTANQAFGPLGNLIFEADAAARLRGPAGPVAQGSVGARGVIGPVALRLKLQAFGADAAAFSPLALASAERPNLGGPAAAVQLGVTGRLSRNLILEAGPELYLTGAGVALRVDAALRLLRAVGDNELRLLLHAYGAPGLGSGAVAAGAGVVFPRGRQPDISVAALVGVSPAGLLPGASVSLGQRLDTVSLDLQFAAEPYRLDVAPLRLQATVGLPLHGALPPGSQLRFEGALASGMGLPGAAAAGTRAWLATALRLPVQLRY